MVIIIKMLNKSLLWLLNVTLPKNEVFFEGHKAKPRETTDLATFTEKSLMENVIFCTV